MDAGNFQRAIQVFEQNIMRSNQISSYQMLVSAYTLIGDIDAAKKTEQDGIRHCSSALRGKKGRGMAVGCGIMEAHMEAAILEAQGKYKAAEQPIRTALDTSLGRGLEFYNPRYDTPAESMACPQSI